MKPSRPNRINGANNSQINSGRRPILSRTRLFNPAEVEAFNQPIQSFWQNIDTDPDLVSVPKLLSVERSAILSVGVERDLESLSVCRRKMLEFLKPGDRADYVDLLLTLSNQYFCKEEHLKARNILEQIVLVERENWHALKELAIILGIQGDISRALLRFEQAENILEKYQQKGFEVAETEELEARAYEARFRVISLINKNPSMDKEKIFSILEPIFSFSQELGRGFYVSQLAKILEAFLKVGIPIESMAYAFGKKIEGELEKSLEHDPSEKIPLRLHMALELLLKGEAKMAKAFLKELSRRKLVPGQIIKAMRSNVNHILQESIQEKVSIRAVNILDRVEKGEIDLEQNYLMIVEEINEAYAKEMDEGAREDLRTEIMSMLGKWINTPARLRGAILLSNELWGMDVDFQQALKVLFENLFENEESRKSISEALTLIKDAVNLATQKAIKKSLNLIHPPATDAFNESQAIYDFFFVKLRDFDPIREIFSKLTELYAEPVGLRSSWYGMLASHVSDSNKKIKLLKRSLQEDPNNIISRLELAREHAIIGRLLISDEIIKDVLDRSSHPLLCLRAYYIQIGNYCFQVEKLIKQQNNSRAAEKLVAEAKGYFRKAEKIFKQNRSKYGHLYYFENEYCGILHNLALMRSLVHGFEKARKFYDMALEINPSHESSLKGKGYLFLLQGKIYEAHEHFDQNIEKFGGGELFTIYDFLSDILLKMEYFEEALKLIDLALSRVPQHLNLLLTRARILANIDRGEEARMIVREVNSAIKRASAGLNPLDKKNLQGYLNLVEAEILWKEGLTEKAVREKALTVYHKAVKFFSGDYNSEYREMDTRTSMVKALSEWAFKDCNKKLFEVALKEGEALLRKYPFHIPAHQVMVVPLANLEKYKEALEHIRWLIDNDFGNLTINTLANLIIFASQEDEIKAGAKELLFSLKGKLSMELVEKATAMIEEHNPTLEIVEGLSGLYAKE